MSEQKKRIEKISELLKKDDEALLITSNANVYYYTGFNNSEGTLVITKSSAYLFVDFRYIEAAKNIVSSCNVVLFSSLRDDLTSLLYEEKVTKIYVETKHMTLLTSEKFKESFSKAGIKISSSSILDTAIENQRMIKSEYELSLIAKAQEITEKAFNDLLPLIKPGVSEKEIKNELEYRIKKCGGEDVSFDLITISGKKTSLPHGVPDNNTVKNGDFFTMDIGALYKGYHSDMTRTVAVGSVTDEQKKIYDIVYKAQTTALESVKAGVLTGNVDKTARNIISDSGYGKCFGHSTGHGVGLDIHEKPNVSPGGDIILSEGMVITIEPGIYLENKFGVRIEDMVAVTKSGYKNFATLPKNLIIL